jgi:hypothetical protein
MNRNTKAAGIIAAAMLLLTAAPIGFAGGVGDGKTHCNSGRGNGSELPNGGTSATGQPNDCDPGNSGAVNHGGDLGAS